VGKRATLAVAILLAIGLSTTFAPAQTKNLPTDLKIGNVRSMTASGNVTVVQKDRKAVAGQALFDNDKRTLTLTDNPRLSQGSDVMTADTMVFYLDDGRSEFLGEGREITVLINPVKQNKDVDSIKGEVFVLDEDQPILVTAKKSTAKVLPKGNELTFDGNVRVRQGQVTMTCDKLVIVSDSEKGGRGVVRGGSGG
jgi:lipopolysaccharide export system protein LptA